MNNLNNTILYFKNINERICGIILKIIFILPIHRSNAANYKL